MGILVLARVAGKSIQGGEQGPAGATGRAAGGCGGPRARGWSPREGGWGGAEITGAEGERLIRAGIRETRWGPTAAGAPHDVSQTGGRISVTRSRPRWQTGQRSISSPVRRSIRARTDSVAGGAGAGGWASRRRQRASFA